MSEFIISDLKLPFLIIIAICAQAILECYHKTTSIFAPPYFDLAVENGLFYDIDYNIIYRRKAYRTGL
jgi:hypothetical protein